MNWQKLMDDGILTDLYKRGFLSPKTTDYIEIYQRFDAYIRQGFKIPRAIEMTADHLGKSTNTVRRAVKSCQ